MSRHYPVNDSYFGGKKVMWRLPNNNIFKQNKIYEIDNFIYLKTLLIQVKLGNGEKSKYEPFNNFTPVNKENEYEIEQMTSDFGSNTHWHGIDSGGNQCYGNADELSDY